MTLSMGILKVEINIPEIRKSLEEFKKNRMQSFDQISTEMKSAVSTCFNDLLNAEMTLFLGKPDQADNKRNGYRQRSYALKGIGSVRIRMPVDRKGEFESAILPKREQMDPRIKEDVSVLHLAGLSTRTLSMVSKRILGVSIGKDNISQSLEKIEGKALAWLERPLEDSYWALFIDGTNFRIQRRGSTEKEPSLVVIGLNQQNVMSILTIQPGYKDDAGSWEEVFSDLKKRGLTGSEVRIGVMDGLPGLERKFQEAFPQAVTARCWVHALKNVLAKVPKRLREPFKSLAQKIMYASSEREARAAFDQLKRMMQTDAKRAMDCLEKDLESLLAHYRFDPRFWRSLRTTNPIERVNKELKRRTKSMEAVGERTLMIVCAFTAMRLEYNWRQVPVDSERIHHLRFVKRNSIESTFKSMLN